MKVSAEKVRKKGRKSKMWRPMINGKRCNALDADTRKRALEIAETYAKFYLEEGMEP